LEISKEGRHLDFHPDYLLSLEGERWIPPGTRVFLLYIASGAHLVLKEKSFFELGWKARLRSSAASPDFEKSTYLSVSKKYVRIGILKIPEDTTVRYITTYWQTGIQIV
jgi:hypothetical protein